MSTTTDCCWCIRQHKRSGERARELRMKVVGFYQQSRTDLYDCVDPEIARTTDVTKGS